MKVEIPELSLVVLVGTTGSGKSTFAARHFKPSEVLSSDYFRGLVSDDENDQGATGDAFDVLHYVAGKRLAAGRLTVVDATNVQLESRKPLVFETSQFAKPTPLLGSLMPHEPRVRARACAAMT